MVAAGGKALGKTFTVDDLERYLLAHLRAIRLTPGEIQWVYNRICGDHVVEVGELELRMFLRSTKLAENSILHDDDYPVVDIAVSQNIEDVEMLEKLHYHRIPVDISSGSKQSRA